MDTVIHQAMWTLINIVVNTTLGWVMAAAGPALALALAVYLAISIWNAVVVWVDDSYDELDDYQDSGASDEARDYWLSHPDAIDPED